MRLTFMIGFAALFGATAATHALSISQTFTPAAAIPDETAAGVQFSEFIDTGAGRLLSISIDLHIAAAPGSEAFLGDLYAYIQHGGRLVPLLNRPGRDAAHPFGYDDNQPIDVRFTEAGGNIHDYRPDPEIPLAGGLTGDWSPDGRSTDPLFTLGSDPITLGFDQFIGGAASGDWTLFVADLSSGAQHQVVEWTLNLEIAESLPEGGAMFLACGFVWAGLLCMSRGQKTANK